MLCYQCAISGCIIRYGITVHITVIECMSRVCELISDDPYVSSDLRSFGISRS